MAKFLLINTVLLGSFGTFHAGAEIDDAAIDTTPITTAGGQLFAKGTDAGVDAAAVKCQNLRKNGQSGDLLDGIMQAAMDSYQNAGETALTSSTTNTFTASSGVSAAKTAIGKASDAAAGGVWIGAADFTAANASIVGSQTIGLFYQSPVLHEFDLLGVDMFDMSIVDGSNAQLRICPVVSGRTKKISFFGVAAVARAGAYVQTYATAARTVNAATAVAPAAYVQTYATTTRTVPNATAVAVLTTAAALTSYGYTQAQADSIPVAINALEADVLELKKLLNSVINDAATVIAALIADNLNLRQINNALIDDQQAYGLAQ